MERGVYVVRKGILYFSFNYKTPKEDWSDRNKKKVANLEFVAFPVLR